MSDSSASISGTPDSRVTRRRSSSIWPWMSHFSHPLASVRFCCRSNRRHFSFSATAAVPVFQLFPAPLRARWTSVTVFSHELSCVWRNKKKSWYFAMRSGQHRQRTIRINLGRMKVYLSLPSSFSGSSACLASGISCRNKIINVLGTTTIEKGRKWRKATSQKEWEKNPSYCFGLLYWMPVEVLFLFPLPFWLSFLSVEYFRHFLPHRMRGEYAGQVAQSETFMAKIVGNIIL